MKKAQTIGKKTLASTIVASLVLSAMVAVPTMATEVTAPSPKTVISIKGDNRVLTAINIAEESWLRAWAGSTNAVIIGSEDANLVDGLAVAPLAFNKKAPILLNSDKDTITAATMAELVKREVKTVYLATGAGIVSDKAVKELEAKEIRVVRLGGTNRYETAKNIAKELGDTIKVAVVNGEIGLADTISMASIAASQGMQIILASDANTLAVDTTGKKVYAIGGAGVISDALVAKIGATRLGGNSRTETNAKVLDEFKTTLEFDKVYFAEASNVQLVDALTGSVLAAQTNSAIVLTEGKLEVGQLKVLTDNLTKDSEIITFGSAVNKAVVDEVQKIVQKMY